MADGRYLALDTIQQFTTWRQVVFSCINVYQNEHQLLNGRRAVFGCQCANPNRVRERNATQYIPQRRHREHDGNYAVQLAICHVHTLLAIHNSLIGVVIYEQPYILPLFFQTTI